MKKKLIAMLLSVFVMMTMMPAMAFADDAAPVNDYSGKTVVIYTGNLRGDVDQYAKLKTAKADFEAKGATDVYLVDAGNYLQGSTYANTTRGEAIYDLMDATGYDVAAMGAYEFAYGDASIGQKWHGNFTKFYTQKMLREGLTEDFTYARNGNGSVTATLGARQPATFAVISSNIDGESAAQLDGAETTAGQGEKLFSFDKNTVKGEGGLMVGFAAQTDSFGLDTLQVGLDNGLSMAAATALPEGADVIIGLSNDGNDIEGDDFTIQAPTDGDEVVGALQIDDTNKAVTEIDDFALSNYEDDTTVAAKVTAVKNGADEPVATSDVTLVGRNTKHRYEESEMGDLVTDALIWYAENEFEGFEKDVPLVAIQNGGNIRKTIHKGDIIFNDIFNAYPYSPAGVGILYVTGEQLLESLEEANYDNPSNAFPQVAGMTYNLDLAEEYDASTTKGESKDGKYGNYFLADSYNRVSITSIGGKAFDPKATYAVVADNMVVANGLDTYGTFKDVKNAEGAKYLNNGTGTLVRDVVKMYLREKCGGKVPAKYAQPQGRITFGDSSYKKAKAAMEKAKSGSDADAYLKAAEAMSKEAAITCNEDKITEADKAVKDAKEKKAAADKNKKDQEAEAKAKKVKNVTVNVATVNAKAIDKAVKKAGGSNKYITKVVLGKKVKKISASALKKYGKVTTLEIKTSKLTKKSVKNSLKGSKVKTVKIKVSTKKATNKKYIKKYKKIFTKKNAGKKVTVK